MSQPNFKVCVVTEPSTVFFKGQGGQKASMTVVVRLDARDALGQPLSSTVDQEDIPLVFQLQLEDGSFVPKGKLADYLTFPHQLPGKRYSINLCLLHARIPFRINKCSARHGGKYRLHIGLDLANTNRFANATQQFAVTAPITVKSKNTNAKERKLQIAMQHHARTTESVALWMNPSIPEGPNQLKLCITRHPSSIYYKDDGNLRGSLSFDIVHTGEISTALFERASSFGMLDLKVRLRVTATSSEILETSNVTGSCERKTWMVPEEDTNQYIVFPDQKCQPRIDLKSPGSVTTVCFKLQRCSRRAGGTYSLLLGVPGTPLNKMICTKEVFVKSKSAWRTLDLLVREATNPKRIALDVPGHVLGPVTPTNHDTLNLTNRSHAQPDVENITEGQRKLDSDKSAELRCATWRTRIQSPTYQNQTVKLKNVNASQFPWCNTFGHPHSISYLKGSFQYLSRMFISNYIVQAQIDITSLARLLRNMENSSAANITSHVMLWLQGRMLNSSVVTESGQLLCSWYETTSRGDFPSLLTTLKDTVACCTASCDDSLHFNGATPPRSNGKGPGQQLTASSKSKLGSTRSSLSMLDSEITEGREVQLLSPSNGVSYLTATKADNCVTVKMPDFKTISSNHGRCRTQVNTCSKVDVDCSVAEVDTNSSVAEVDTNSSVAEVGTNSSVAEAGTNCEADTDGCVAEAGTNREADTNSCVAEVNNDSCGAETDTNSCGAQAKALCDKRGTATSKAPQGKETQCISEPPSTTCNRCRKESTSQRESGSIQSFDSNAQSVCCTSTRSTSYLMPPRLCSKSPAGQLRVQLSVLMRQQQLTVDELAVSHLGQEDGNSLRHWIEMTHLEDASVAQTGELAMQWAAFRSATVAKWCYQDVAAGVLDLY